MPSKTLYTNVYVRCLWKWERTRRASHKLIKMLKITPEALEEGVQRATDIFYLQGLRSRKDAAEEIENIWAAFGVNPEQRERLLLSALAIVPIEGDTEVEAHMLWGVLAGVLIGLIIADSATPLEELDIPTYRQ